MRFNFTLDRLEFFFCWFLFWCCEEVSSNDDKRRERKDSSGIEEKEIFLIFSLSGDHRSVGPLGIVCEVEKIRNDG